MTVPPPAIRTALRAPTMLLALAAALLAAAPAPPPAAPAASSGALPARATSPPPVTVEPTLPLRLDVAFESFERGRGRVRIDLVAIDEVHDLEIELLHDAALAIPEETSLRRERLRLRPGEARGFRMDVEAKEDRDLPLRLEATFRTADGKILRLGQGTTLAGSRPPPQGRLHLGAHEYPALVLGHPQP